MINLKTGRHTEGYTIRFPNFTFKARVEILPYPSLFWIQESRIEPVDYRPTREELAQIVTRLRAKAQAELDGTIIDHDLAEHCRDTAELAAPVRVDARTEEEVDYYRQISPVE